MTQMTKWDDYQWPDWVPWKCRERIVEFWQPSWGRSPETWTANAKANGMPALGEFAECLGLTSMDEYFRGRYVHAWNNIGWVVADDGTLNAVSSPARKAA